MLGGPEPVLKAGPTCHPDPASAYPLALHQSFLAAYYNVVKPKMGVVTDLQHIIQSLSNAKFDSTIVGTTQQLPSSQDAALVVLSIMYVGGMNSRSKLKSYCSFHGFHSQLQSTLIRTVLVALYEASSPQESHDSSVVRNSS